MENKMENKIILQKNIPERNHLSPYKINYLDNSFFLSCITYLFTSKNTIIKPLGLWYSLKWYWIENLSIGMYYSEIEYKKNDNKVYEIQNEYLYEIILQPNIFSNLENKGLNKILILEKLEEFRKFYDTYKYLNINDDDEKIDWKKVYMDYGGIEIRNVHLEEVFANSKKFWYGWDVPSGCIWNKDLIKIFRLIL